MIPVATNEQTAKDRIRTPKRPFKAVRVYRSANGVNALGQAGPFLLDGPQSSQVRNKYNAQHYNAQHSRGASKTYGITDIT